MVEYGKMRSELNECALGVDLRGIHSAFYFYQSEARNANSASSGLNLAAAWPAIHGGSINIDNRHSLFENPRTKSICRAKPRENPDSCEMCMWV